LDKTPSKVCRDCLLEKPAAEFWASKVSPDGRAPYCIPCFKIRNTASGVRRAAREGRTIRTRQPRPAGIPEGYRFCPRCEEVLPQDRFVRNRTTKSGYGSYCRPCQNAKASESIARRHGSTRHYHLKQRYGIGADEVELMLDAQRWRCLICAAGLTAKTAHVDHDHATGAVRGILCFNCNGGLRRAADYVSCGSVFVLSHAEWRARTRPATADPASPLERILHARLADADFGTAS
jgi:Recombination endonuclease VII